MASLVAMLLSAAVASGRHAEPQTSLSSDSVDLSSKLPEKIVLGYANWCECDEKIVQAVEDGVNVVVWFNTNLKQDDNKAPLVESCTDLQCVAKTAKTLEEKGLPTVHLMSIGGWNSPHPDTNFTGQEWFQAWEKWNTETAASEPHGFHGFDGFDWDIEGNDDQTSTWNMLPTKTLKVMGEMSIEAKKHGYIVAMAPAQSYLDASAHEASYKLNNNPSVPDWHQDFPYHGRNAYAYLLAEYGTENFDLVTLQLYEGWSRANYEITKKGVAPSEYVRSLVRSMDEGWKVTFPDLGEKKVSVPASKLIIGLANGWAKDSEGKFLFIQPSDLATGTAATRSDLQHRGYGFWNIGDEGTGEVHLARGLNAFMNTRQQPQ